jgi:hypothetical protein
MLKHQLKIDPWSRLLIGATPSAARSPFAAQAQANRDESLESESTMSRRGDRSSYWVSVEVVLTTARVASGL